MNKRCNTIAAFAVLEAAGLMIITSVLIFLGLAIADFLLTASRLEDLTNRVVKDNTSKGWKISAAGELTSQSADFPLLTTKTLTELWTKMQADIGAAAGAANMYAEVDCAEIVIDPATGNTLAVNKLGIGSTYGSSELASGEESFPSLEQAFKSYAGKVGSFSPYASPNGVYRPGGELGGAAVFLPSSYLIGVRAAYSFKDTVTGSLIAKFSKMKKPVVGAVKVVAFRGDVG